MSEYLNQRVAVKIGWQTVRGYLRRNVICGDEMWSIETRDGFFVHLDLDNVRRIERI
jgi:hypothetical protein